MVTHLNQRLHLLGSLIADVFVNTTVDVLETLSNSSVPFFLFLSFTTPHAGGIGTVCSLMHTHTHSDILILIHFRMRKKVYQLLMILYNMPTNHGHRYVRKSQ